MLEQSEVMASAVADVCESGDAGSRSWSETHRERRRVMKVMLVADPRFDRCSDCRVRLELETVARDGRNLMATVACGSDGTNSTDLMNSKAHPVNLRELLTHNDTVFLCVSCNRKRRTMSVPHDTE